MKGLFGGVIAVAILPLLGGDSHAGPIHLSVSTTADVNHLTTGQTVTFTVDLSGVSPGDSSTYLSYLAATVGYDNALLSPNPSITTGAVISDGTGFVGTGFPGAADAFYDSVFLAVSGAPISSSGTFFSFTVTANQVGTGTLSFSSAAATLANDPDQNDQFAPDTGALAFTITAPTTGGAVPAPPAWVLGLSGALVAWAAWRKRKE